VKILLEDSKVNNQIVLNNFKTYHENGFVDIYHDGDSRHSKRNGETYIYSGRNGFDNYDQRICVCPQNMSSNKFCQSKLRTGSHKCNKADRENTEVMGDGGILKVIKSLQMLDSLDIEGIISIYNSILRDKPEVFNTLSNFKSESWRDAADYLTNGYLSEKKIDSDVMDICKYLISSTFKDCSIIITFQRNSNSTKKENNVYHDGLKCFYEYQIKLIDVDPRHVSNIPYYFQVDREIVSNFLSENCKF